MKNIEVILILITVPDAKSAECISTLLVDKRLAACVNTISGVSSLYRWEGKLNRDDELILMIKTVKENFDKICLTVISIHPYDMPEIIAIPIVSGATQYMEWIKNETSVDNEM